MISTKVGAGARGTTRKEPRKGAREAGSARVGEGGRRRGAGGGVPSRALADGVVERRRMPRPAGRESRSPVPAAPPAPRLAAIAGEVEGDRDVPFALISPQEHYRREQRRRAGRIEGDLASLLAEAKAEYEALINAPRPAGKGGRPRKKAKVEMEAEDEDADLDR